MASTIQELKLAGFAGYLTETDSLKQYRSVYDDNRHRIYALAFWMTDNELEAEELMGTVFRRAFSMSAEPSPEAIDRALVNELRTYWPLGVLTLECAPATAIANVRGNVLRTHLERAVVQLPATERLVFLMHDVEGYSHMQIGRLLGLSIEESQHGLHQARLRMRELLAAMQP
jgi:RNA polymerase sigma-70 factor (ECF subfamily)